MVAETIAQCNNDTLVSISAAMKMGNYTYTLGKDEPVGFVMPTYYYGIPIRIPDFIDLFNLRWIDRRRGGHACTGFERQGACTLHAIFLPCAE